jgi:predicted transcriptional regulator
LEHETLINLAADIVLAYVSNNSVSVGDVPGLIEAVYGSLANVDNPVPVDAEKPNPAVSIRSSVKSNAIACLECGQKKKMLKRHLTVQHGLSASAYRAKWNLGSDYPLVAPDYAALRKSLALKIGLGRKPGSGKKADSGKKAGRPKKVAA